MKYTFLVLLFLSSSLAYSENNEVIGIFQQKQLGSVIAVFIINTSTQDFVYVKGHGDSKLDYKFTISNHSISNNHIFLFPIKC